MNAITTQQQMNPSTRPSESPLDARLSARLSALLASGETKVVGPKTAAALRAYLDGPWPDLPMPTPDRIDSMVSRLALATKERKLSDDEATERLELFWRVLRDLPLVDLAAAFDDLLRTSTFMPTPAEVYQRASSHRARREYRKSRARHLVWLHDREWRPPLKPEDMASPEEIAALLAPQRSRAEA